MIRNIAAIIAAILVAFSMIMLVEWLGHQVYPPPADFDFGDPEQVRAVIAALPVGAILFVAAAWAIGAFAGTFVGAMIGTAKPYIYAAIVGGLVLAGAITNLIIIPHPIWFSIAAPVGVIVATWLAWRLAAARRTAGGDAAAPDDPA